jgi:hypothetical protein
MIMRRKHQILIHYPSSIAVVATFSSKERSVNDRIKIMEPGDWEQFRNKKLNTIVDPMIFRTADVFLCGQKAVLESYEPKAPETVWSAISSNIGALCTFFDILILEDCLPIFDYETTFPPDLYFGSKTLFELCNEHEQVLVPVTVGGSTYQEIKQRAVEALDEQPPIPPETATDILAELSAFDYEWRPDLWRNEKTGTSKERVLDAFRYGGLLFSGYAQRTGADHIVQPKRSRLYLAASLGAKRANDEQALFAELTRLANSAPEGIQPTADLPSAPTFLPYLLNADDKTPRALLTRALKLRKSGAVADYRSWRRKVNQNLKRGKVPNRLQRELRQITADVIHEIGAEVGSATKVSAKMTGKISFVGPVPVPEIGGEIGAEKELNPGFGLGWVLRNLPGYRYRKLLLLLVMAQREYWHLDSYLKGMWITPQ